MANVFCADVVVFVRPSGRMGASTLQNAPQCVTACLSDNEPASYCMLQG